jgi:hypothetical protein
VFAANDGQDTFKKAMQFYVEDRFTNDDQRKKGNFHHGYLLLIYD